MHWGCCSKGGGEGAQTGGQGCGREVPECRSGLGEGGGRQRWQKEKMGVLKGQGRVSVGYRERPEGLFMYNSLHVAGGVSSLLQIKP